MNKETYHIYPVGYVRRTDQDVRLEISEGFRPALKQLEGIGVVNWSRRMRTGTSMTSDK